MYPSLKEGVIIKGYILSFQINNLAPIVKFLDVLSRDHYPDVCKLGISVG